MIPENSEKEKKQLIETTKSLEEALAAVDEGAVAVYKNTYPNEPLYCSTYTGSVS